MHRIFLIIAIVVVASCADPRQQAVEDVLEFAARTPYELAPPTSEYSGYGIAVIESDLAQFNTVFERFVVPDSVRTTWYRTLPERLLYTLPVTQVQSISFREIAQDTAVGTVVFQRPDQKLFDDRVAQLVASAESSHPPSSEQQSTFRTALQRMKSELQQTDTAFFTIVLGPKILNVRTATQVRDSARLAARRQEARTHLDRLVRAARVSIEEFVDYSSQGRRDGTYVGGSIKGWVDPDTVGWLSSDDYLASTWIECEGRREAQSTSKTAYLAVSRIGPNQEDDFLCLWYGQEGSEWVRIRPTSVRVRLVGAVAGDSVFGEWITVR